MLVLVNPYSYGVALQGPSSKRGMFTRGSLYVAQRLYPLSLLLPLAYQKGCLAVQQLTPTLANISRKSVTFFPLASIIPGPFSLGLNSSSRSCKFADAFKQKIIKYFVELFCSLQGQA